MQASRQQNNFFRIYDLISYQQSRYSKKIALAGKENQSWVYYSTQECMELIDQVSAGFLKLGLKKGDKIGLISHVGSPQWNILDLGAQQIGVIVVPIHATASSEEIEYILKDAEIRLCFASILPIIKRMQVLQKKIPSFQHLYSIQKLPEVLYWKDFLEPVELYEEKIEKVRASISEGDLATIIYTSGTTGLPKGVMLSHRNIVSNIKSIIPLIPINYKKQVISFLPLSHIFERMVTYTYIAVGASLYYAEKADTQVILENISEIRPHYFTAVPRLLERMHDGILQQADSKKFILKKLIYAALKLGAKYKDYRKQSILYWIQFLWIDLLVFRKWRKVLGGRVEGVVVGAAALHPDLSRLFSAAGIKIREGYGLTETSPVVSFNRFEPGGVRFGSVGIPIPGVEVRIQHPDEEGRGEILVRGPNVMMGYYNKPAETQKVFLADNWFCTGDVGKFIDKKFLCITDRKKNIFKTSSGKYIAPQVMETLLKTSPYIERCMVIGFQRPFLTALIVPHFPLLQIWCDKNQVHWTAPPYMVHNPKIVNMMNKEIELINSKLPRYQQIRKHHLLSDEWSVQGGELGSTLKIKRTNILQKYQREIKKMYT